MKDYPLFLPSVIKTFATYHNKHINDEDRLRESREALLLLIKKKYFKEIVIVDGSNNKIFSDLEIEEFTNDGIIIEQLMFVQNREQVEKYGKGHGEMQITNYMVEHSQLVNKAGGFVKLTPRYFFDNIEWILPLIQYEENVFFYYYPCPVRMIKKFVMTIFYKTSLAFYKKNLRNVMHRHSKDTSGLLESIFYYQLRGLPKKRIKVTYPYFSGVSGTTGKNIRNQYVLMRTICSKLGLMVYSFK